MNINDFQAQNEKVKKDMEKKIDAFKLEKVLSLWYFVLHLRQRLWEVRTNGKKECF